MASSKKPVKPVQGPLATTTAFVFPPPRKPHVRQRHRPQDYAGVTPAPLGAGPSYVDSGASVRTSGPHERRTKD